MERRRSGSILLRIVIGLWMLAVLALQSVTLLLLYRDAERRGDFSDDSPAFAESRGRNDAEISSDPQERGPDTPETAAETSSLDDGEDRAPDSEARPFTLRQGEHAWFGDIRVTLLSIEDASSRDRGGDRAKLRILAGAKDITVAMNEQESFFFRGYEITLQDIQPARLGLTLPFTREDEKKGHITILIGRLEVAEP